MRTNKNLKYLSKEVYDKAYRDLELFCKDNTQLLLFGEFGDASFPSISDLDVFICLTDDNFELQRKRIIQFIDEDEVRKYLFFHDPLILPLSLLPYLRTFHTAYNLTISFREEDIELSPKKTDQIQFLNKIWTTYLMGIGPELLINSRLGIRDKLLVIKNICQSIYNLDPSSNSFMKSEELRDRAYKNQLSTIDINIELESLLRDLYLMAGKLHFEEALEQMVGKAKIKVEFNKTFIKNKSNNFLIDSGKINIELNPVLYNLFFQFYTKKSGNPLIQNFINKSLIVNDFCKQMNTVYPFIAPFGFQFYRTDIKFAVKKRILSI